MRQTDKSLQSEKFKQVVGGLEKKRGLKVPSPTKSNLPEIWTGYSLDGPVGVFWDGPRGCAVHS